MRLLSQVIFSLLVLVAVSAFAQAQTPLTQLATLGVDLWPDYDRPSMLVLLTGELPPDAPLPATVTIPLPETADINAVARFGETGGLFADVAYTVENGRLTLTTPSPRFRVEYYVPYELNGNTRSYQFNWTGDLAIDALTTVVQQPAAAESMTIAPEPRGSERRADGLLYFILPDRSLLPGQPHTVEVSYEMPSPRLSAATTTGSDVVTTEVTTTPGGVTLWWLLGLLAIVAAAAGAYFLGRRGRSATAREPKPKPIRRESAKPEPHKGLPAAKFCHNCGRAAEPGDSFCRGCGTKLKI